MHAVLQSIEDFVLLGPGTGCPISEIVCGSLRLIGLSEPMSHIAVAVEGLDSFLSYGRHLHNSSHKINIRHGRLRSPRDTGLHTYETHYKLFVTSLHPVSPSPHFPVQGECIAAGILNKDLAVGAHQIMAALHNMPIYVAD